MKNKLTFKRFNGEYIVTYNKIPHIFAQYENAWAFIISIIKREEIQNGKVYN